MRQQPGGDGGLRFLRLSGRRCRSLAGAKIWPVLSDGVQCSNGTTMVNWDPAEYLFEYNPIVHEKRDRSSGDDHDDDHDD